ncbi:MAG: DNA/RNA nuclease SfsA [Rhodospirillaceae bacterium]|jgi:sugar fermentation stimulation protein A|nr:DNA/RNA nuclease SfsA [Rhodospirillaceae bacterium]
MRFEAPLLRGTLIRRYKRFLTDVTLEDGRAVTAHCPNPGAMLGLTAPGSTVWLSPASNPARKLKFTWELIEADGTIVGINTGRPNALAEEAILAGRVPGLEGYARLRREVKYGRNSRIDILLEDDDRPPCYVEVKNVHFVREAGVAEFPDSVTARGAKHLDELADVVAAGGRGAMLYVVQRSDCRALRIAGDLDPAYAEAFARARAAGVEALAHGCKTGIDGIELAEPLIVDA